MLGAGKTDHINITVIGQNNILRIGEKNLIHLNLPIMYSKNKIYNK